MSSSVTAPEPVRLPEPVRREPNRNRPLLALLGVVATVLTLTSPKLRGL